MDQKTTNDVETLLRAREAFRAGCSDRVSLGWKINLALWSTLGLLAGVMLTGRAAEYEPWWVCVIVGVLLATAILYVWWIAEVGKRNETEAARIRGIDKRIRKSLRIEPDKRRRWCKTYHSQILQVAITVALLVLVGTSFWARRAPKPSAPGMSIKQPTTMRIEGSIEVSEK